MHARTALHLLSAAALTLAIAGCRPDAALRKSEVIGDGTKNPGHPPPYDPQHPYDIVPPANAGAIAGTILFSGKVPTGSIDTSMDPACALGSADSRLPVEQIVATGGRLANVFVYVKSGPPAAMQSGPISMKPAVLDQQHCRYVPHVLGIMQGGTVEFRNSDPTMHNIHTDPTQVGNQVIDISQGPRGVPQTKSFPRPELMIPVRCNNHPWMNAFINVSPTAFFAVSGTDGKFTISGLPPGDYVLGAVHEKLGEKTFDVSVPARNTAKVEFAFRSN